MEDFQTGLIKDKSIVMGVFTSDKRLLLGI